MQSVTPVEVKAQIEQPATDAPASAFGFMAPAQAQES